MSSVLLYPLGVGDSATVRHWWTHLLLDVGGGRRVFVDCPGKFDAMLAQNARDGELPVAAGDYREVLLTHIHTDHDDGCRELAENPPAWLGRGERIRLYGPPFVLDALWSEGPPPAYSTNASMIRGGAAALDRVFEPVPLDGEDRPHDLGGFTVTWRKGRHSPQAVGYKFDFGGVVLAYSADTGTLPAFQQWLDAGSDVVVHEVHLGEVHDYIPDLHTPLADLLALPESFQRKTLLCHYADDFERYPDIGAYRYLRQNKVYRLFA